MSPEKQLEFPGILEKCLTLPQAAKAFNIPVRALRIEIACGNLSVIRIGTKRWRVLASDLKALIERRKHNGEIGNA